MGSIHYLPSERDGAARLLARTVGEAISRHPEPRVAERWAAMARLSVARWPGPPLPSRPALDLDALGPLDEAQRERIVAALERWMDGYFADVRDQLMEIHGELLSLQRRVAEHEVTAER